MIDEPHDKVSDFTLRSVNKRKRNRIKISGCERWEEGFSVSSLKLGAASEIEYADWLTIQGYHVKEHRGRYWKKRFGFFEPVHWMAKLHEDEISNPCKHCWGYRAALKKESAHIANGSVPLHLHENVSGYGAHFLCKTRRWDLRKCLKHIEIKPIYNPDLLFEEGFELYKKNYQRTHYGKRINKKNYCKEAKFYFDYPFISVLGGFIENRLVAYLVTIVVEETAYLETIVMNEQARLLQACTGLQFAIMKKLGKEHSHIKQLVDGLHARENHALCKYKEKWGFHVAKIPSSYWFLPGIGPIIKKTLPHKYYRLTGK